MRSTTLTIWTLSLLAACTPAPPPVRIQADSSLVCEALRPDFPLDEVKYHSKSDTPDTQERIKANNLKNRSANARFAAACK